MTDPRLVKKWKVVEIMLVQASEWLFEPNNFKLGQKSMAEYEKYLRANELELAMLELEAIAYKHGAKSGFWRRLQKAAITMELQYKVDEYESAFHDALSKSNE